MADRRDCGSIPPIRPVAPVSAEPRLVSDFDWLRLHQLAVAEFDIRLRQVQPHYWEASTPCDEWDVLELVNHNVVENLWVPLILGGHDIDDVGGLDGNVVGSDPELAWEDAWRDAVEAFAGADLDGTVRLAAGRTSVGDYLRQRTADLTVHAWDLAVGADIEDHLDDELVHAVLAWATPLAGVLASLPALFEPPITPPQGAGPQERLLHLFGREP